MWKAETRRTYDRKGLRYPTDMTDAEWELARPFVDIPQRGSGRQRRADLREVLNAVFYILGTGCQWRALPKDLPPRSTVHDYFVRWQCDGTLGRLHHALYEQARELAGKEASPTTAIVDSQSVKGAERGGARSIRWAMMQPRRACPREGGGQRAQATRRCRHARPDAGLRHSARQCAGSGWLPGCPERSATALSLSGAGDRRWRLPGPGNGPGGAPGGGGEA